MSISYYDLLDVAPDATQEEIRAAWREAVADLDPTARRFAVYNEAASVLLDPERRAAYDAQREAETETEAEAGGEDDTAEVSTAGDAAAGDAAAGVGTAGTAAAAAGSPAAGASTGGGPTRAERRIEKQARRKARRDAKTSGAAASAAGAATAATGTGAGAARTGGRLRSVPLWALAGLAVVLVGLVAASIYLVAAVPSDDEIDAATRDAQSAAEQAIVPVLSYDHRSLEADGEAAREWMTDDYQEKYDQLFSQIEESAPQTKTVVRTEVVASGLIRSGEDRVQVLVFVDRPTRNKALDQPVVYKDQVRVTMEKVGDRWLVDQLCTTASCES